MRFVAVVLAVLIFAAAYGTYFYIPKSPWPDSLSAFTEEKKSLEAQIQALKEGFIPASCDPKSLSKSQITAQVFSVYPLNTKNEITVNKGENDKVREKAPVLYGCGILIGNVVEVFPDQSVVRTIFDPNFSVSVEIGEEKINGLLKGGASPALTLVEKQVSSGDGVFAVSSDFPFGVKLGEVGDIETGAGGILTARLVPPFSVRDLREVKILR